MKKQQLVQEQVVMSAEEVNARLDRYFRGREAMKSFNPEDSIEDAYFFNDFKEACRTSLDGLYKKYPDIKARVEAVKASKIQE